MNRYIEVHSVLIDIEAGLRSARLWSSERPSDAALASDRPFAVDTLALEQWLQFIFLPRMMALVQAEAPLPENCGIAPMAEEAWGGAGHDVAALMHALKKMDALLTE